MTRATPARRLAHDAVIAGRAAAAVAAARRGGQAATNRAGLLSKPCARAQLRAERRHRRGRGQ